MNIYPPVVAGVVGGAKMESGPNRRKSWLQTIPNSADKKRAVGGEASGPTGQSDCKRPEADQWSRSVNVLRGIRRLC